MNTAAPVCEFKGVTRRFLDGNRNVTAIDNFSLTVQRGEFIAIMGPSGSGKSSVLNLAGGLDVPTEGQVLVHGQNLAMLNVAELAAVRRRRVGYIFQRLNLLPTLTAEENVMLPLELDGMQVRSARSLAAEALESVGLAEMGRSFPDELSGGQQQRVAIARALVGDRTLLLADEPTGALDTTSGEAVLELLAAQCEQGRAVVLVTHEPRFASFADRVIQLRDGCVVTPNSRVTLEAVG
jgi:putative ABC transport system ATP-binding protein